MIYVCVPARDEARTIGVLVWKIRKVMLEFGRDFEVVVMDDASSDDTRGVLSRYTSLMPLRVLHSDRPLGYAESLDRLVRDVVERSPYPKRDVAVTLQGDFTEDPADLVAMVKTIEGGADLVAGTIDAEPEELPGPVRWSRRLAPWVLGSAMKNAPISDPLSGYRAYRVIVLKKALRDLGDGDRLASTRGWGANLELLSHLAPHARRIEETPYRLSFQRHARESRFRARPALTSLLGLRRTRWPGPTETPSSGGAS